MSEVDQTHHAIQLMEKKVRLLEDGLRHIRKALLSAEGSGAMGQRSVMLSMADMIGELLGEEATDGEP